MIEIEPNTNIKNEYEKIKKDADMRIKKMFTINPQRSKGLPVLVILFYNTESKVTYEDSQKAFDDLRYAYKLQQDLVCTVELNGKEVQDMTQWSNYARPIFNIQYKLHPSDPICLIGDKEESQLRTFANNHKAKIRDHMQMRLRELCKRYE